MYHFNDPYDRFGPSVFGGVMMLLMWALIIIGIVLVVRCLSRGRDHGHPHPHPHHLPPQPVSHAREALDMRFAKGEISEDEYTRMRLVLDGTPPTS